MKIFIDSDLVSLMNANSYLKDFVYCEIDKISDKQEYYIPIYQHFNDLGINIITDINKNTCVAYIRLVI